MCLCVSSDVFYLFTLQPKKQEARACLYHTGAGGDAQAGTSPLAGTHGTRGRRGSVAVHLLQKQSRASLWPFSGPCEGKGL